MSSLEEKRKLKTSIRPNGKIRPIPKNSATQILLNDIQPGNTLVNFHDEYLYDRFYKPTEVEQIMKTTRQNPLTRKALQNSELETYLASVNGNTGGKTISEDEYTQIKVFFFPHGMPDHNANIKLEPYIENRTSFNSQREKLYDKTTPLVNILSDLMATNYDSYWYKSYELKLVRLFGIPDSATTYILKPEYKVFNKSTLLNDYSIPLSSLFVSKDPIFLKVGDDIYKSFDVVQVYPPTGLPYSPHYTATMSVYWTTIRGDIKLKIQDDFKTWLSENPEDFEQYKKGIFTENTIKKGAELGEYARKEAIDKFMHYYNQAGRRRFYGGTRRRIRRSKKTRNK